MDEKMENKNHSDVDKGLVATFLRMSPEERLTANDNAVRAILELRNAFQQQKAGNEKIRKVGYLIS